MSKKIIRRCLSLIIMMVYSLVYLSAYINADNLNDSFLVLNDTNDSIAYNIHEYAVDNISSFIYAYDNDIDIKDISLGEPVIVNGSTPSMYILPVYKNGDLYFGFSVTVIDDQMYGNLSISIAQALNYLLQKYPDDSFAILSPDVINYKSMEEKNGNLYFYTEKESSIIEYSIASGLDSLNNGANVNEVMAQFSSSRGALSYYEIGKTFGMTHYDVPSLMSYPKADNLAITITEQQGSYPWCGAYVGAAVLRYLTNRSYTAESLMKAIYPTKTLTELRQMAMSLNDFTTYCYSQNYYPYNRVGMPTYTRIQEQISTRSPLMAHGIRNGSGHSFLVLGYLNNASGSLITIWNPHNSSTEITTYGKYIVSNNLSWEWFGTIDSFYLST